MTHPSMPAAEPTTSHTIRVNDQDIFYREARPDDAPAVLLRHGFPSSSRMYQPLLVSALGGASERGPQPARTSLAKPILNPFRSV